MPGVTTASSGPTMLAHRGRFVGRADDAAHAGSARLFGAAQHQRVRIVSVAGVDQVLLVHRGQHGDAEQAEAEPRAASTAARIALG